MTRWESSTIIRKSISNFMYIQRRQTLINAVRPLARDESAVFLYTYLRSTTFCYVCLHWTKQLRPALYLPVAATTSGGWLQPFAVPAAHTPCERPAWPPHKAAAGYHPSGRSSSTARLWSLSLAVRPPSVQFWPFALVTPSALLFHPSLPLPRPLCRHLPQ